MDVIDLDAEREKRDGPDPPFVSEVDGEKWFTFSASYLDGEAEYSFSIWAKNMEDAKRRIDLIRSNLKLDGQVYERLQDR